MRIVSLLPSATEIICALGLENQLVGRSHECDFPATIQKLPSCTQPKYPAEGSSEAIDTSINTLVSKGLSIYEIDVALLEKLAPDFIVTQSHCEVCAVSYQAVEQSVHSLLGQGTRIIDLQPRDYNGVFADIQRVGEGLDKKQSAQDLIGTMKGAIATVERKVLNAEPVKVLTIEWLAPLMNAGNWMPRLIQLAGGVDVFAGKGLRSHFISWEEIVDSDPDLILLIPCGFSIQRTMEEVHLLTEAAPWATLRAVKENRVFIADGNQYFNRPGPRLSDSVEILGEILHPAFFDAKYEHTGWIHWLQLG